LAESLQRSSDAKLVDALQAMRNHRASHFARQDGSMSETDTPGRDYPAALVRWFPQHAKPMDSALSHWMCQRRHSGRPVVLRSRKSRDAPE